MSAGTLIMVTDEVTVVVEAERSSSLISEVVFAGENRDMVWAWKRE